MVRQIAVVNELFTFEMKSEKIDVENPVQLVAINNREEIIYFFGFITYRDGIGNLRRTAFCRMYDPKVKRFTIVHDPDYEYVD